MGTTGSFGPNRIAKTVRDANGRPTQIQVAFGVAGQQANERTLGYSANGQITHLIDANVNRTTYEYDGHDRLVKTRFPITTIGADSSSTTDYEQITLDANGNVTNRRLRDGNNIVFTYDALNRATLKNLPGSEPDVTYAYDLLNRLTSASQAGHSLSFTYDALSRNLTQVSPQGTVTSEWDLAGRRTKITWPGSALFVNYDYDLLNNVTFIRENGASSGVGVLATYQYDSLSRRSSLTFGNGVVQNFTYDNASRLASLSNNLTGTLNDLTAAFAYNPASQITSTTRTGDAYAWTGHSNQNLGSTANGLNQITNYGAKTITHDTKGNITGIGSDAYSYSSENLLLTGPSSTTLTYDPQMRLYQLTSGTTSRMAYDGLDRIAEYDGSNALLRRYVHGPGLDDPLVWYEGTGTTDRRFLSSDERGSIISLTDSSGTLLGINGYDEYGVPQSTNIGVWGYTGQARIPQIKVWYYKARMLSDELGRFLQTDPIGYGDGMNMYAYVGNDPVNLIDPTGQAWATGHMPGADGGSGSGMSYWQMVERIRNAFPEASDAVIREALNRHLGSLTPGSISTTGSIAGSLVGSGGSFGGYNAGSITEAGDAEAIIVCGNCDSYLTISNVTVQFAQNDAWPYAGPAHGGLLGELGERLDRWWNDRPGLCSGEVSGRQVADDAVRGAYRGAATGALRGGLLGSWGGPPGSAAGAAGGSVTGAAGGAIISGVGSSLQQSCGG